ncbi:uncharacterized protein STEHIDRAFT_119335 [Stereum hirsutum FP-91666 SS1]|uniref:uncharacterized protein n=1 Tax=Stereum hirsutum (strain FP-91666) TaxID=721885 RepID=UPI000440B2CF|nr:uncharacterized protein STEHIDRAFT_119335 [Stereum hirsutum FP-91666 SS1]EIM90314.1 hypothetical protein STEHIDRAFT_119335 [Stereum hirsutum FP-91666 SS1]
MSASWNRKPGVLPHVPPEIWQRILEMATLVPGSLDPDIEDPFDCSEPRRWRNRITKPGIRDEQEDIRDSLITKRYVVRVCKQWYTLGMPLLYQSIFVGRERMFATLLETLRRSQNDIVVGDDNHHSHPLGWWTRRLDFRLRDSPHNVSLGEMTVKVIDEIFSLLTNLSIFVLAHPPSRGEYYTAPYSIAVSLFERCGSTLQMLSWGTSFRFEVGYDYAHLTAEILSKTPALRTVHGDFPVMMDTRAPIGSARHLTSLITFSQLPELVPSPDNTITFPALQQFYFIAELARDWHPSRAPFMATLGANLTTLYIRYSSMSNVYSPLSSFSSEYYPRLVHLIIICSNWTRLEGLRIPPQMTHLGLLCEMSQNSDAVYEEVFMVLRQVMTPPTPSLRIVRFLNPRGTNDLRDRHRKVLLRGLRWLALHDLRVEDHEGRDMRDLLG